jgi:hypothetical protein
MTSNEVPEASMESKETSTEQFEESLGGQQVIGSVEASLSHEVASDRVSQSWGFEESETMTDVTYDFGQSTMTKSHLASLESSGHYFTKGYGRPPRAESVLDPRQDKAIIFEDFFTTRLHMPPHPVLLEILRKFQVQ